MVHRAGAGLAALGALVVDVQRAPLLAARLGLLVEPRPEQGVVDFAYNADGRPTALVAAAREAGCRVVVDGLEALVRQGAASFRLWTGVEPPVEAMRAALGLDP